MGGQFWEKVLFAEEDYNKHHDDQDHANDMKEPIWGGRMVMMMLMVMVMMMLMI